MIDFFKSKKPENSASELIPLTQFLAEEERALLNIEQLNAKGKIQVENKVDPQGNLIGYIIKSKEDGEILIFINLEGSQKIMNRLQKKNEDITKEIKKGIN